MILEIDGVNCPVGEICLKEPVVFHGYYKNDEKTKRLLIKMDISIQGM